MTGQDNSQARAKDEHSECVWEETIRAAKSSGRARPEVSRGGAPGVVCGRVDSTFPSGAASTPLHRHLVPGGYFVLQAEFFYCAIYLAGGRGLYQVCVCIP
jgi:hypothetical protein